ncbi:phosphoglycerate dehydrogenase [Streptomyces sp. enrichment culture]|uniref:phosphoglycerate dehydrogenase n=1 Tax=Streptomyces sp. enrichment culture TaxID=1795815 RepID=UPI003F55E17D
MTTQYLRPGDEVDALLRAEGCRPRYSPWSGRRTPGELERLLDGARGAIVGADPFTAEVLRAAPGLRVISRTGVGYDSIDLAAAAELGITVCNTPGVNRHSVAEMALLLMLMSGRRIAENLEDVRTGGWRRLPGGELRGATLGLIGCGGIGQAVAELALAFGMTVLAYDPCPDLEFARRTGVGFTTADDVLERSDFLSLHLFLSPRTRHWLNADRLARMKPTAHVINTARGAVVDEAALASALAEGRLAGAGLDVTDGEPLAPDSPLRALDNCVVTPHIGGSTAQARRRSGLEAAHNVLRVLRGEPPRNVVGPPVRQPAAR